MKRLPPKLRWTLALILGTVLALGKHMPHGHDHGLVPAWASGNEGSEGAACEFAEAPGCCDSDSEEHAQGHAVGHAHGHGSDQGHGDHDGCGGDHEHPGHVDPFCQLCSVAGVLPVGLGFVLVGVGPAFPGIPAEPRDLQSVIETGPDAARGPPRGTDLSLPFFQA